MTIYKFYDTPGMDKSWSVKDSDDYIRLTLPISCLKTYTDVLNTAHSNISLKHTKGIWACLNKKGFTAKFGE